MSILPKWIRPPERLALVLREVPSRKRVRMWADIRAAVSRAGPAEPDELFGSSSDLPGVEVPTRRYAVVLESALAEPDACEYGCSGMPGSGPLAGVEDVDHGAHIVAGRRVGRAILKRADTTNSNWPPALVAWTGRCDLLKAAGQE